MEIAYSFFRFGRYSYDIVDVLESMGSVAECDKSAVLEMATITREMVLLSVKLMHYIENILMRLSPTDLQKQEQTPEPRCYISALLILSYLNVYQIMLVM